MQQWEWRIWSAYGERLFCGRGLQQGLHRLEAFQILPHIERPDSNKDHRYRLSFLYSFSRFAVMVRKCAKTHQRQKG